jgi:hypothetical protein
MEGGRLMSGPSGTWTTTSGGGPDIGTILALGAIGGSCAVAYFIMQAVASIPAYVWVLIAAAVTAGTALAVRRHRRNTAAIAAAFAALRAEREAADAAEVEARHQRRLAIATAGAPVITNHVWTPEAIEAMRRGYAPTTVITAGTEEITR